MKCKYCGNDIPNDSRFCPLCGQKYEPEPEPKPVEETNASVQTTAPEAKPEPKVFKVFAQLGFIFGIISLVGCWIPLANLLAFNFGVPGIIFSAISKAKVKDEILRGKASKGLVMSIIGTILSLFLYIFYFIFIFVFNYALFS